MRTWRSLNRVLGHLIFGLPALASLPALAATIARFGLLTALTTAALPALVILVPWLLWLRYTRHEPSTGRAYFTWGSLAFLVTVLIWVSPLWFWNLPVLALLLAETIRCTLAARRRCATPTTAVQVRS